MQNVAVLSGNFFLLVSCVDWCSEWERRNSAHMEHNTFPSCVPAAVLPNSLLPPPFFPVGRVRQSTAPTKAKKKKLISRNELSTRSYFLAWIFNFAPKLFRLDKDNSIKSCHPQLRDDDDHERGSKLFPKEMNSFWPHAHPHRRRPLPFSR